MCVGGCSAAEGLTAIDGRMHRDEETERKGRSATNSPKIGRTRLGASRGPEGGFRNCVMRLQPRISTRPGS